MSVLLVIEVIVVILVIIELLTRCIYYFRKPEFTLSRKILLIFFGRWLISEYTASSAYIEEIASSLGVEPDFMVSVLSEASGKDPQEIRKIFLEGNGGKEQYRLFPMIGFTPVPEQALSHMTTNKRGFRGKDVPLQKGTGIRRIVLLGGSVAFGRTATSDRTTIAYQLENMLNSSTDPKIQGRWEVINLAVPDFITYQELNILVNTGMMYEPDIVISLTGFNDAHHYLATGKVNSPASLRGVTAAYTAFSGGALQRIIAFLGTFFVSVQYAGRVFSNTETADDEELSPFIYTIW